MKVKRILFFVAIAGIIVGGVWLMNKYGNKDKRRLDMALFIVSKGYTKNLEFLLTTDDDYLKAWYQAAKAGDKTFTLKRTGKTYSVQGGSVVVNVANI